MISLLVVTIIIRLLLSYKADISLGHFDCITKYKLCFGLSVTRAVARCDNWGVHIHIFKKKSIGQNTNI
jgi:hypothetical protein